MPLLGCGMVVVLPYGEVFSSTVGDSVKFY